MNVFDLLRRGPKTSEFWAAIVGTAVGLFMVKEGQHGIDLAWAMSPLVAQVLGRNAVKVVGALKAGEQAGEGARAAVKAAATPGAPAASGGSGT
jgi:hypothetical protein